MNSHDRTLAKKWSPHGGMMEEGDEKLLNEP